MQTTLDALRQAAAEAQDRASAAQEGARHPAKLGGHLVVTFSDMIADHIKCLCWRFYRAGRDYGASGDKLDRTRATFLDLWSKGKCEKI